MFKVGSYYEFLIAEDGGQKTIWGTVARYEHPLLQLEDTAAREFHLSYGSEMTTQGRFEDIPGRIINITSTAFISAQEREKPTGSISDADRNLL